MLPAIWHELARKSHTLWKPTWTYHGHITMNPACAFPSRVRISAVDIETLELDGVGRVGEPLGDGDGSVVVGPPDAGALVPAVDLEEGRPFLAFRRSRA